MMRSLISGVICLIAGISNLMAQDRIEDFSDASRVELLAGWREPDGTHIAGIKFRLFPGWKTYWRNPGEIGIPPRISLRKSNAELLELSGQTGIWQQDPHGLQRSQNLADANLLWTAPEIFKSAGMVSLGYTEEFVLPLRIVPKVASEPSEIFLNLTYGLCKEICIPVTERISARLPATESETDAEIVSAMARVLRPADKLSPPAKMECEFPSENGNSAILAKFHETNPSLHASYVVFDIPRSKLIFELARPEVQRDTIIASSAIRSTEGLLFINRSKLRAAVIGENDAIEFNGCNS